MKSSLEKTCYMMVLTMLVVMVLPMLAKKKKQLVVQQLVADTLPANDRMRYRYFLTEAGIQRAADRNTAAFDLLQHAAQINPYAAEVYFLQADYYQAMKQDSMTQVLLQKAILLAPDNLIYAERLAQYYIGSRQYDKAIEAYERLYAKKHSDTEILTVLLQLYQQQKNYPMMLETLNRLETEDGENEQITLNKMRVYEMMNDKKAAYGELKSLTEQHPLDMVYKTMLGNWLMQHDRQKEAYAQFAAVLKEEPDNAYAQMSLYDYYNATQQTEQAKDMLDKILMGKKTDTDTKVMMFQSFIQNNQKNGGDSTEVLALFDKVLAVPHPSADLAELRAVYMAMKKMPADSISLAYKKVLEIAPDKASARLQLVQALWNKKAYAEVIAQTDVAHEYNPDEMIFYYFGGMAHYLLHQEDETLSEFKRALAQVDDKSQADLVSDLYMIMGDIYYKKDMPKESFAAYDSCLQWKDDNIPGLNNYAYYLSETGGDLHKAEAMSYKTIKAEPKNGTYLDTYAWILFKEERYADAKTYIDAALKNSDSTENSSAVIEHAGDIYSMNGMADEAVDFWKKAYQDESYQTDVLKWKIDNRQYVSKEMLQKRNKPMATTRKENRKTNKKVVKKGR